MNQSPKHAAQYVLDGFVITSLDNMGKRVDITPLIHTWHFVESMDLGFISGEATIYDSVGLIDQFYDQPEAKWLKGEEQLDISFTDTVGENLTLTMMLYAISEVEIASVNNSLTYKYKIHFTSVEKFHASKKSLRIAYSNDTIDKYVQHVFDENFESMQQIVIEPTYGTSNLVVPNLSPDETMSFFARKAFAVDNPSQTFRFFQTKRGFFFATHDALIKFNEGVTPIKLVRTDYGDQSPTGQQILSSTIIDIKYPQHVNTFKDINKGAYYSTTTELDYLNRTPWKTEYRYLDDYGTFSYVYPDRIRSKHSKEFVDKNLSDPRNVLVVKDYADTETKQYHPAYMRPDMFYRFMYNHKNVNHYHHQNELIEITIYGRALLTVGDLVELDLREINYAVETPAQDLVRSGKYMVESIDNIFYEKEFIQKLKISRSGVAGNPEPATDYNRLPQVENGYMVDGTGYGGWDQGGNPVGPGQDDGSPVDPADPNFKAPGYPDDMPQAEIEKIIREEAALRGLDPDTAVKVFRSEGATHYQSQYRVAGTTTYGRGGKEASYGPYQLYVGVGLGREYERRTGRDLRTDNTREGITNQIRFSLDVAASRPGGWNPWHGAGRVGLSDHAGGAGSGKAIGNWS